jgi:L-cystine transport system permease protein
MLDLDPAFLWSVLLAGLSGIPLTFAISIGGMGLALVLAMVFLALRLPRVPVLSQVLDFVLLVLRSVPLLVQLFLIYYGVPALVNTVRASSGLPPTTAGLPTLLLVIIAFGISTCPTVYNNLRSALYSVPHAQIEAAQSVGMTKAQCMWRIVRPQALSALIRPLGNTFISMMKASSIAYFVSLEDIMGAARIVGTVNFRFLETFIVVALIYWAITVALGYIVNRGEAYARRHVAVVK